MNKPELATVEDNTTITIDDYGVVKDKDRDCRGYYPKHEQEVSFKGEMTGVRKVLFFTDVNHDYLGKRDFIQEKQLPHKILFLVQ